MTWVTTAIGRASDRVDIHLGGGLAMVACQPDAAGDCVEAPGPFELLLSSLGACTAMTLRQYATARGWPLEAIEVDLTIVSRHSLRSVERILSIQGPLDPDQREELLAAAEQSPVTLLLRSGMRVQTELA